MLLNAYSHLINLNTLNSSTISKNFGHMAYKKSTPSNFLTPNILFFIWEKFV